MVCIPWKSFKDFLMYKNELLTHIDGIDSLYAHLLAFYLDQDKTRFPHQISFQIQVSSCSTNIFQTTIDEGAQLVSYICHVG